MLRAKVLLASAAPIAAYAAEQAVHRGSASSLSALAWTFIIVFSLLGWAVADLDKVADLWAAEGQSAREAWKARLVLVKTIAASVLAGICMFFLGKLAPGFLLGMMGGSSHMAPEIPEMLLLIFTAGAGYMGSRWWDWFEAKFFKK
jgi:hypothetical protein